jgi:putative transposase
VNAHWFLRIADAAEKLEALRGYYNEERRNAIGKNVPGRLAESGGITSLSH